MGFFSNRHSKQETVRVTFSNRTVIRFLGLVLLSYLFLVALGKATHALTLIFIAAFLSLALNAPVHALAQVLPGKRRGSRTLATGLSFFLIIAVLGGFIASIAPPLVKQTTSFINEAPHLVEQLRSEDSTTGKFIRQHKLQDQVDKFSTQLSTRLKNISGSAVSTITKIGSSIFAMLTVLVLTFMMLIEGPRWVAFARRLLPDEKEPHFEKLAHDMYRVVKGYVNGQVLLAGIASLLIVVPLFLLHVSYPIALMVIIFICGLIPLVGHTIGAVIVSTVALFQSPLTALIVLVYYITYQQIENYAIQPRIQANSTDMSPLLVFMSVIIGVSFSGLLGGLVAIPIAGCTRILILDYLNRKKLLDPADDDELPEAGPISK
ncbi:MAG: family transporter [Candidatus Saccharibacteria bacterium]|nr:family transporter [Candidatus Saccharibacteria bacterium]